jgi:tungstate transport system substrate-binding protein
VATTTSLYDTGLWDTLEPLFEDRYGVALDVISGGTGKALEFGRRGDVDVLTIHDKAREERFVADGYGVKRYPIAYNYFLIVGPQDDPAGIGGMGPEQALLEVMNKGQADPGKVWFVSRGDDSGTHAREKLLWQLAGQEYDSVRNSGAWYLEAGAGMGAILVLTDEKSAYTLTDVGTYLAFKRDLALVTLVDRGDTLLNVYSAIAISPEAHPDANVEAADRLIQFLLSAEVQDIIGGFGLDTYGTPLFTPAKGQEPQ